jgi:hypothetical protein
MTNSQTGASRQPNPALIFDGGAQLPVQFRDTASIYVKGTLSLENLSALNISGSCQYSEAQLENVVKRIGSTGSLLSTWWTCARSPTCSSMGPR